MVASATGLGRSGLFDWLIQRLSAVILAVYTISMFFFLVCSGELSFSAWHATMSLTFVKVANFLVLLALSAHAWVGLWIIATDYLNSRQLGKAATPARLTFLGGALVLNLGYLVWGAMIIWGV